MKEIKKIDPVSLAQIMSLVSLVVGAPLLAVLRKIPGFKYPST
jgi:hypothetical protein